MAIPEEVQEWLNKADEDCRVAEVLLRSGEELRLTGNQSSRCLPCFVAWRLCERKLCAHGVGLTSGSGLERTTGTKQAFWEFGFSPPHSRLTPWLGPRFRVGL